MKVFPSIFVLIVISIFLASCSQVEIPEYPGAIEDQEHEMKYFGISLGNVRRVVTDDSYDTVVAFYRNILDVHNPEVAAYTLEDGRQTAITITKSKKSFVTVAIQEFKRERKTAITYMKSGNSGGWFSLVVTWLLALVFN